MIILSDIVMNFGGTSGEIFIDGLAHYWDIDADSMIPLVICLRSDASVTPVVILLDHSDKKKDSALMMLKTYCGTIRNSMRFLADRHNLFLVSSLDKCVLKVYTKPDANDFIISCGADFVTHSYMIPPEYELFDLDTSISQNIGAEVYIFPMLCRLAKLDDKRLYELDPFLLPELDWYGIGVQLMSEAAVQNRAFINAAEQTNQLQIPTIDMEASPPISYYGEYLLMDLDGYMLSELDRKI